MAFKAAKCDMAYGKFGVLGFTGSGKTFLAKNLAIGMHEYCVKRGAMAKDTPVYFLDTETGSDWVRNYFEDAKVPLFVDKTRAFTRLVPAIREAEEAKAILIIDSITHHWRELTESYANKKGRTSLRFEDWAWLKAQWAKFTDAYVNSQAHIIMCGRAGYEYDFEADSESGKKELVKTGIKLKAEAETGYEPSILVLMNREVTMDGGTIVKVTRTGQVLKDRGNKIDGMVFVNPTFNDFLGHIECLNIGGKHVGVDAAVTSEGIVPPDIKNWEIKKQEAIVTLDEIQAELVRRFPRTTAEDKAAKADLMATFFGTRSWKRIETLPLQDLRAGLNAMLRPVDGLLKEAENVF